MFLEKTLNVADVSVTDLCNVHQQNDTVCLVSIHRGNRLSNRVTDPATLAYSGASLRKAPRHVTSRQPITHNFFTAAPSLNLNPFWMYLLREVLVLDSLRRNRPLFE